MNLSGIDLSDPVVQAVGWALLHSLWQGALVAVVLAMALQRIRDRHAEARYMAALTALALMAALPLLTFVLERAALQSRPASSIAAAHPALEAMGPAGPSPSALPGALAGLPWHEGSSLLVRLLPWLTVGWLAGVSLLSLRLLGGWVRLRSLQQRYVEPTEPVWQERFAGLCRRLEVTRPVRLLTSAAVQAPMAIGWLRPVVLVPGGALLGLSATQLEAILAHELAHIRRNDYLVNLVQCVVETLLFYHPAVWWISEQVRIEREHCCDDVAVAACGSARTYALALTGLEQLRISPQPLALGATGGTMLYRIRRLLNLPLPRSNQGPRWLAGAIALAAVVTVGSRAGASWKGEEEGSSGKASSDDFTRSSSDEGGETGSVARGAWGREPDFQLNLPGLLDVVALAGGGESRRGDAGDEESAWEDDAEEANAGDSRDRESNDEADAHDSDAAEGEEGQDNEADEDNADANDDEDNGSDQEDRERARQDDEDGASEDQGDEHGDGADQDDADQDAAEQDNSEGDDGATGHDRDDEGDHEGDHEGDYRRDDRNTENGGEDSHPTWFARLKEVVWPQAPERHDDGDGHDEDGDEGDAEGIDCQVRQLSPEDERAVREAAREAREAAREAGQEARRAAREAAKALSAEDREEMSRALESIPRLSEQDRARIQEELKQAMAAMPGMSKDDLRRMQKEMKQAMAAMPGMSKADLERMQKEMKQAMAAMPGLSKDYMERMQREMRQAMASIPEFTAEQRQQIRESIRQSMASLPEFSREDREQMREAQEALQEQARGIREQARAQRERARAQAERRRDFRADDDQAAEERQGDDAAREQAELERAVKELDRARARLERDRERLQRQLERSRRGLERSGHSDADEEGSEDGDEEESRAPRAPRALRTPMASRVVPAVPAAPAAPPAMAAPAAPPAPPAMAAPVVAPAPPAMAAPAAPAAPPVPPAWSRGKGSRASYGPPPLPVLPPTAPMAPLPPMAPSASRAARAPVPAAPPAAPAAPRAKSAHRDSSAPGDLPWWQSDRDSDNGNEDEEE